MLSITGQVCHVYTTPGYAAQGDRKASPPKTYLQLLVSQSIANSQDQHKKSLVNVRILSSNGYSKEMGKKVTLPVEAISYEGKTYYKETSQAVG